MIIYKKINRPWIRILGHLIILAGVLNFFKSHFVGYFFIPDQEDRGSPYYQRIPFEEVYFPSLNGSRLHGYFMMPDGKPLGTIIHCHGNGGNVTAHHGLLHFLVKAGYQVLAFDYQGYGQSEGRYSPEGIIEDTLAAINYVHTRPDVNPDKLVLFGQSLGGAAAAGAMRRDKNIQGLILEGTFTTYETMAWNTSLGRILFFLTPFVIPDIGPIKDISRIQDRPVLIIHGKADTLVPHKFAKELYDAAGKFKNLLILEDFQHLEDSQEFPQYREAILQFLKRHLS